MRLIFTGRNNRSRILFPQNTNNQNIELKNQLNGTVNWIKYIHLAPNLMKTF